MQYDLPKTVEINGVKHDIRSDFRPILDIRVALGAPELDDAEKATVSLRIFYPDWEIIPIGDYREAIEKCYWFINGGRENTPKRSPKLMDWEQDFDYYIAPINRIAGQDIRGVP